jgi:hypothetical protein
MANRGVVAREPTPPGLAGSVKEVVYAERTTSFTTSTSEVGSLPLRHPLALVLPRVCCYHDFMQPPWEDEWDEWYRMTPLERWRESEKLWEFYLRVGGSLDPEPDSQSPFYFDDEPGPPPLNGRPGLRVLRRGGI